MSNHQGKRLRPPPRLRVKTGCQTCLQRRKKCDETRPVCDACDRLHLQCIYRSATLSPEPVDSEKVVIDTQRSPLTISLSVRPDGLSTQRDWNVFNYCSTKYLQVITSPEASGKYRDLSFIFAIGFEKPWVMHAALAPAAYHASFLSLISTEDAVLYSQSALRGLRQSLLPERPATLRRDPCLTTSLFLGVFEEGPPCYYLCDFYWSARGASLIHYQAIAQILEAQFANSERLDINTLSVLQLTLLDSTLYHLSTRLILEQDVDAIFESFPAKTLTKYIQMIESKETDMERQPQVLPVLGRAPPALFLQILRLTWLSRKLPLDQRGHRQLLQQCLCEMDRIQLDYPVVHAVLPFPSDNTVAPTNSEISAKLYYIATQIFVAKISDPEYVTTRSVQVQDSLLSAISMLEAYDTAVPCGQFICWPLLVLGCMACPTTRLVDMTEDDRSSLQSRGLIRNILLQIWNTSYSGYVRRTSDALEKIWNMPDSLPRSSAGRDISFDGLNALINKDGLGAVFLDSEIG